MTVATPGLGFGGVQGKHADNEQTGDQQRFRKTQHN